MEATTILSVKDFPLFAPMTSFPEEAQLGEDSDGTHWYMCLWKMNDEGDEICSYPCGDFTNYLYHLKQCHGVVLRPNIDVCCECALMFKNKTEAVVRE